LINFWAAVSAFALLYRYSTPFSSLY